MTATLTVERAGQRYIGARAGRGEITKETVRSFRETLLHLFAPAVGPERPLRSITRHDVESWIKGMTQRKLAAATVRLHIGTLKGMFRWAVIEGHVRGDPTTGLRLPKLPRFLPRGVPDREVIGLLCEGCQDDRDRLIVLLMRREGLRAIEVANLQLADIDWDNRTMVVTGKGGHQRALPVVDEVHSAILNYLGERGRSAGHMLQSHQQSYANPDDGLTAKYVARLAGDIFKRAGVKGSGHALRHSFATELIHNGGNVRDAQVALGHVSIATTQRYLGVTAARELRGLMEGNRIRPG